MPELWLGMGLQRCCLPRFPTWACWGKEPDAGRGTRFGPLARPAGILAEQLRIGGAFCALGLMFFHQSGMGVSGLAGWVVRSIPSVDTYLYIT
jgi:hypothetical protein